MAYLFPLKSPVRLIPIVYITACALRFPEGPFGREMDPMPLDKVCELLETEDIRGTPEQLNGFCIRIRELVEMNGAKWVRSNRDKLLNQWEYLLDRGI